MRRRRVLVVVASAAAVWGAGPLAVPGAAGAWAVPAARGAVPSAGSWRRAIEVPGLGALNKGDAEVTSVSCGAAGNCAAGGYYTDRHHHSRGFVASERHGRWGKAIKVPGPGALYTAGGAGVSCGSAGNCAAGGYYRDRHGRDQGFVIVERHGRWGKAIEVPGPGALNKGGGAGVSSVSCASAGNCAAVGLYTDRRGHLQMFAASQRHGRWGKATEVPGLGAVNTGGNFDGSAFVSEASCASARNCAAGGDYTDQAGSTQGFVASERDGRWGKVIEVPGLGTLNKGGGGGADSVSCGAAGSCAAVGDYTDGGDNGQGFVAVERHGRWGKAINVPGLRALNYGFSAEVDSVSCASAGNCAAVGAYAEPYSSGFVVSEKNGVWGKAIDVPGLAALNGRIGGANSVSCASPGNCAAGGFYSDSSGGVTQGFVAVERHGRWGKAIKVPGLGTLNKGGDAAVFSVSCGSAGSCAAGGYYTDRRGHTQGFVVSQTG
jgi:hypothetical protein